MTKHPQVFLVPRVHALNLSIQNTTGGKKTLRVSLCKDKQQSDRDCKNEQTAGKVGVTYGDGSSSLQSELVGKLVGDGAAATNLSFHLPVAQRLILQQRDRKREERWKN